MAGEAGAGAVDRGNLVAGYTLVSEGAPASRSGYVTKLSAYCGAGDATTVYFAFFTASTNDLTLVPNTRVGVSLAAGSATTIAWNAPGDFATFSVTSGNYLGFYDVGNQAYNTSGGSGIWYTSGNHTDASAYTFNLGATWIDGLSADIEEVTSGGVVLAGRISGASSISSLLPYIYHYLINNVVAGVATIGQTIPYIFRRLIPDAVDIVSSTLGNIEDWATHALTAAVNAIATTYGNLTGSITGAVQRFKIYMKIHRGRF